MFNRNRCRKVRSRRDNSLRSRCFRSVRGAKDRTSPVAPRREVVASVVQEAYDKFKNEPSGKNADYIPYLAQVDSKLFGIAIVTTDNQVLTHRGCELFLLYPIDFESLHARTCDGISGTGQDIRKSRLRAYRTSL